MDGAFRTTAFPATTTLVGTIVLAGFKVAAMIVGEPVNAKIIPLKVPGFVTSAIKDVIRIHDSPISTMPESHRLPSTVNTNVLAGNSVALLTTAVAKSEIRYASVGAMQQ
jgi:hypothetical protein